MNVTADGRAHLKTAIGTPSFVEQYVSDKVNSGHRTESCYLHCCYTALCCFFGIYTHNLISNRLFVARIIPNVGHLFQPLEDCARNTFILAVTGQSPPGDLERALFPLPARLEGLGIINPTHLSSVKFCSSYRITEPLQALLLSQSTVYSEDVQTTHLSIKFKVYHSKSSSTKSTQADLLQQAPAGLKRFIELASEKEALSWLTVSSIARAWICSP